MCKAGYERLTAIEETNASEHVQTVALCSSTWRTDTSRIRAQRKVPGCLHRKALEDESAEAGKCEDDEEGCVAR